MYKKSVTFASINNKKYELGFASFGQTFWQRQQVA